jgi:hypothetical protein
MSDQSLLITFWTAAAIMLVAFLLAFYLATDKRGLRTQI